MRQNDFQFVRSLLQRRAQEAGPSKAPDGDPPEVVDYDWHAPARFTRQQLARLEQFVATVAEGLSRTLAGILAKPVEVKADAIVQQFGCGEDASDGDGAYRGRIVIVNQADLPCGTITLPGTCATRWVAGLLGGSHEAGNSDRELSSLENALLTDATTTVIQTFSELMLAKGAMQLRLDGQMTRDAAVLPGSDGGEFCKLDFHDEASPVLSILLASDLLDPVAADGQPNPDDGRGDTDQADMAGHLMNATVISVVTLGQARLSMQEILSIAPGDVLLLDKQIGEPIEVAVQGKDVLAGLPATCKGQYAVKIVGPSAGDPA